MTDPINDQRSSEAPPILKTWGCLYASVLGFLALLIVLFYWFGKTFS